jgi:hypothetical protein
MVGQIGALLGGVLGGFMAVLPDGLELVYGGNARKKPSTPEDAVSRKRDRRHRS